MQTRVRRWLGQEPNKPGVSAMPPELPKLFGNIRNGMHFLRTAPAVPAPRKRASLGQRYLRAEVPLDALLQFNPDEVHSLCTELLNLLRAFRIQLFELRRPLLPLRPIQN